MFGLNWTQVRSGIEKVLLIVVGLMVGKGWIPASMSPDIVAAVLSVLGVAWGLWNNRPTAIVQKAEALPEVKAVQVTSASGIANADVTGPKVTT